MRELSFDYLNTRLKRIVWLPLGLMAGIFVLGVSLLLYAQHKSQLTSLKKDLIETMDFQEPFFSQEILNDLKVSVQGRVADIIRVWRMKSPTADLCVRVESTAKLDSRWELLRCTNSELFADWNLNPSIKTIAMGGVVFAKIQWVVTPHFTWRDLFPPILFLACLIAMLAAYAMHRFLVQRLERNIVTPLLSGLLKNEGNVATAKATKLMAHDVKRPFSFLKTALETLASATDKEKYFALGRLFLPQVSRALASVDAMAKDITEIGTNRKPETQEVAFESLLSSVLEDAFRLCPTASIKIEYEFGHNHVLWVEPEKMLRVFANILENAIQAMSGRGKIWVKTKAAGEVNAPKIEIRIGNTGPSISASDLGNVFEYEFTTKEDGTGLGLYIAKQIVEAHGGSISCHSSEINGTEFILTLPCGQRTTGSDDSRLPRHSSEIAFNDEIWFRQMPLQSPPSTENLGQPAILVFDDDEIVHKFWQVAGAERGLKLNHYRSWEDFVAKDKFSLATGGVAFVDINYRNSKVDGFAIARNLRELGVKRLFAITADERAAIESGLFDAVFGKGMPEDIETLVA